MPAPNEFHPPVEEYLQTIASLIDEGRPVIQARIAERLHRTPPSVAEMMDRLAADGYIRRSGRRITLTKKGRAVADSVIRKHRLAERLLVDVIGLPWHLVHDEAGRWEHVMSDAVEARLVDLLGDPGTCPHGNPIPGSAHRKDDPTGGRTLAEVAQGQTVQFTRLTEEVEMDASALRYLDEAGFIPGATATIESIAPDDTLILKVGGKVIAIGRDLSRQLYVDAA